LVEGRRGDQGGRATGYVDRILKGERPADSACRRGIQGGPRRALSYRTDIASDGRRQAARRASGEFL